MKSRFKIFMLFPLLVLCLAFILSINLSDNSIVYAGVGEHNHEDMQAWGNTTSLPTSGSYYLTTDVRINTTCTVSGTLNLCLNGHGIIFTGTDATKGSVFSIGQGKTLNLYDCGTTEHKFRMKEIARYKDMPDTIMSKAGLAEVDDTLTENYETFTGGYITGGIGTFKNGDYYYGGGVYVDLGTFNMYGGTIIGNTCKGSGSSPSNKGGAVAILGGNFTMYDGRIIANTVDCSSEYSYDNGGGVFVNLATNSGGNYVNGYFTMNGGSIERNSAYIGGGISIATRIGANGVWFTANGGSVKDNISMSYGGGLTIQCSTVNLTNFEISGNMAKGSGAGMYLTGSTYNNYGGTLNMTNCNVVENYGEAVYISGDTSSYNSNNSVPGYTGSIVDSHFDRNYGCALIITGYSQIASLYCADFTIKNTTINDNVISNSGCAGLSMSMNSSLGTNGPRVTLEDCEIIGNISNYQYKNTSYGNYGLGVSIGQKTVFNIKGRIIIDENYFHCTQDDTISDSNLNLSDSTYSTRINIIDKLSDDSHIGVASYYYSSYGNITGGTGVVTNGLNGNGTLNMFSHDSNMFYLTENSGEVAINIKAKIVYNRNNVYYGQAPATGYFVPGGEAVVADQGTLSSTGYTFIGWNTLADGTGTLYKTGDTFEISEDITLYAIFGHGAHDDADFIIWTDELALAQNGVGKTATNSLPSVAGDYALANDVTITSTWYVPVGTTNLCLDGHGIRLNGSGSVMIMGEGVKFTLHDCDTTRYTKHYYTSPSNGYGLATDISDTQASGQTYFTGGYITGGTGYDYEGTRGGGMLIENGADVTIKGGTIIGNKAQYGGGIMVRDNGKLTITGGVIRNNTTENGATWYNGAGVFDDHYGILIMTGGSIINNYSYGNSAGGVVVDYMAIFTMTGGYIQNNASNGSEGCGINIWSGDFYISGNSYVRNNKNISDNSDNNICINNKSLFHVGGEITSTNSSIGITFASTGIFSNTTEENIQYNDESKFFSDNTNYMITTENGQLCLIPNGSVAVITNGDTNTYYTSMANAITNWADGTTLKLITDVSGTQITSESGTKTLDLNNHSVTYTSGSVIIVGGGTLTIQDSSTNKTKHYYTPNTTGVASISNSVTNYYFDGGYLTGGVATGNRGGGLRVTGGEINFVSGTIFACRAGWGGGIWTSGTSLVTISNTAAIIGCYSSGDYTSGGGIFCEGSGAVTMTGGSIKHNSSQYSGAGVRVCLLESTGTYFTMTGGEITGNYSNSHQGSGLALDMADRIKVGGSAKIYGNDGDDLFLKNGGYITIVEQFTEDALIVVKTQTLPTETTPVVITDAWSDVMGDASFKNTIKWYDENYRIKKNSSGELVASVLHIHFWTYSASENVITATCYDEEDCTTTSQSVTLNVEGKDYDGTPVVATLVVTDDWTSENGLAEIGEITYSGNRDAGTYIASITVGEITVTKEFIISKSNLIVTITGHNNTVDYDKTSHKVSGYDVIYDSDYYSADDVLFKGIIAEAQRTNAGTTVMGLKQELFNNTNENYNVTFVVIDGYQTINAIEDLITVKVVGHNNTTTYDRQTHKVSGYDITADSDLYDITTDIVFDSAIIEIQRKNAGTTYMGLNKDMFYNVNGNFTNVVVEVTDGYQTINKVDTLVRVTVTGHSDISTYDRQIHKVIGYDITADSEVYIPGVDVEFDGVLVEIQRTNVGTTIMGLNEEMFYNINRNFTNVVITVVDGFQTISSCDDLITVTVTGHNDTSDYDGTLHTVSGYDISVDSQFYDVTNDIIFSGTSAVTERINAGTSPMGLQKDFFENINNNFTNVQFVIIDGYQTISTVDAVVTTVPVATDLIYNEEEQKLVSEGEAEGGTILYALMTNRNAPDIDAYTEEVPFAKELGYYYVWYKVIADRNHNNLEPVCLKIVLGGSDWVTLGGELFDDDNEEHIGGVTIILMKGNQVIDSVTTDESGNYQFKIPTGNYNIITEYQVNTETKLINVVEDTQLDMTVYDSNTESLLNVEATDEKYANILVGGLSDEANLIRETQEIPDDKNVTVMMTVQTVEEENATNAQEILAVANDKYLDFFNIKVEKKIDSVSETMSSTTTIMEVIIPYEYVNKHNIMVYSYHNGEVVVFTEINSGDEILNGTFIVDKTHKLVHVFTNQFSTFAIGYTPYYTVNTTLTMGSFTGKVNITLTSQDDDKVYTLEDVELDKISFDNIPMGSYMMTITWVDGVTNSLSIPFSVGKKISTSIEPQEVEESSIAETESQIESPEEVEIQPVETIIDYKNDNLEMSHNYSKQSSLSYEIEKVSKVRSQELACIVVERKEDVVV